MNNLIYLTTNKKKESLQRISEQNNYITFLVSEHSKYKILN